MPAIFPQSSGAAANRALQIAGLYVAIGRGDPAWDAVAVDPPSDATELVDEVGRRVATCIFVTEQVGGEFLVHGKEYTPAEFGISNKLYIVADFDNADAVGDDIREAGVFVDTVKVGGLPGGQTYFEPADLASPGYLLLLDRFTAIARTIDFRFQMRFVISL